jgi:ABC-2 type transport system ATP-binding protein
MTDDVVAADDLGKRYRRRWALQHCTLAVPRGRVIGLVGANGAGKTTLLHLVAGLLDPTEGTVMVFGDRP